MKSTKIKAALLAAIAALGITGYLLQQRFDARLAAQDERLRQAAAENARLQEQNLRLAQSAAAGKSPAPAAATAPGPAQGRPAGPGGDPRQTVPLAAGMTPVLRLGNAGRATARGAFETQLWAARTGDIALEASAITLDAEGRARLEALAASLPEDMRAEYDTPEKLMAYMLAGSPHPVGGMQVLGEVDTDANDATLQTEWQHVDDDVVHQSEVTLVQGADGWKMLVPDPLVNRASNYLSRNLAPPQPGAGPGK
jgi:hypothetical protein